MDKGKSRIAKNTLMLYCRMFLTMGVSLFTSRVVLNALGINDYGVYNVVGGVVSMLGFFNSSIATSTQRYLNVGMADENNHSLRIIFSTAVNVHFIIGIITVLLLETVGLWFVENKLVIPPQQHNAALWVYQCSIISFFISIISSPYNAAIIAYEKMQVFAFMSIIDVCLRLGVALSIVYYAGDKLRLYAILLLIVSVIMRFLYSAYCSRNFTGIKYKLGWNFKLIREMLSFSGWMIFGCVSDMLSTQGVNMLINIFFGPMFNAARAVAVQVQSAVAQFSSNFIISVNPQIVKSYAAGDYSHSEKLVFSASKVSFFLMMVLIIPIIMRSGQILALWLGTAPQDTAIFLNLILGEYLIRSSYTPIAQINQAGGNIKLYQLSISSLFVFNFVISYILFKMGFPVYSTFIVSLVIAILGLFVRLIVLKVQQKFPLNQYLCHVTVPILVVALFSMLISYWANGMFKSNIGGLLLFSCLSVISSIISIWIIGLNKTERSFLIEKIIVIKHRFCH